MERKGEGVGERGGGLPVMSSYCRPPKLLIRKSAIYRLLRRDRTLKDQQLGRVRGKLTRVLHPCKHQNQLKAKRCICAEVREKFYMPEKTRQLSLEPLYVGTKSSLPRATRDAETQDRTGDLQIFSLTLSQLSYRGLVADKQTPGCNALRDHHSSHTHANTFEQMKPTK